MGVLIFVLLKRYLFQKVFVVVKFEYGRYRAEIQDEARARSWP